MKPLQLLAILFFLLSNTVIAQEEESKGKFYGDVFLNTNYNLEKEQASFRLNRLHFGYKYEFTDKLYFNGMVESAREDYEPNGDYNGITNLFEFCLGFKLPKIEGKIGLIGTEFNQQQEKLWKHRYVDKVFADKYGFAPTNDFGFLLIYKPADLINVDFAITNGEGHKTGQTDSVFRYSAGINLKPAKGFVARLYGDMVNYPEALQSNFIGILGYSSEIISVGAEWNQQFNSNSNDGYQRNGLSAYFSYNIFDNYQIFSRFDHISSSQPDDFTSNWNIDNDGKLIIAGIQFEPHKKIKFAIDYRTWITELDENLSSYLFLDIELAF